MIIITGAAGFIGSCLTQFLNKKKLYNLVLVDDFGRHAKKRNLLNNRNIGWVPREDFFHYMQPMFKDVQFVFHLGARTDTTEMDESVFEKLNLNYSKNIWELCSRHGIPLIYASSAATYGGGEHGFVDQHNIVSSLTPLNPYGRSKNSFDQWALEQNSAPPFWAGLKFFNVYGPNEYHKGRMASVIFHAYHQIKEKGSLKLFRSHNPDFANGEQKRDFIYVKDLLQVLWFLFEQRPNSGIYNLGTGQARTFNDLANGLFSSMNKKPVIEYFDTPVDLRDKYQYFTQADMTKLNSIGYNKGFVSLEDGVKDYVQHHLAKGLLNY